MSKLNLLINEIKDKYIQENFRRIVNIINSGTISGLEGPAGRPGANGSDGADASESSYDGAGKYSTRFGEIVDSDTIKDAIDEIFDFQAVNPSVVLSINPSATREKGNTLSSIILSTVNTAGQNPVSALSSLTFNRGASVINTVNNPTGTSSFNETTAVTDTTTFSATLLDAEGRSSSNSKTISFLYPVLYLVGAKSLTPAQIYSGASKILSSSRQRTLTFSTNNQVSYYCYPATIAALSDILDINGFSVINDWDYSLENIVGLDGSSQSYRVYEFKNLTVSSMDYTFI